MARGSQRALAGYKYVRDHRTGDVGDVQAGKPDPLLDQHRILNRTLDSSSDMSFDSLRAPYVRLLLYFLNTRSANDNASGFVFHRSPSPSS